MFNNKRARSAALALAAASLLAFAPGALASGSTNSGGVNSGGTGGGGGGTTTTTTGSGTCATITGFSNSNGYYSVWAAIWTQFSISSKCSGGANWRMTYTNNTTGNVDFSVGTNTNYEPSGTVDEDWAAFSTSYTVALTVTDPYGGAVLDSRTAQVTTKVPKEGA